MATLGRALFIGFKVLVLIAALLAFALLAAHLLRSAGPSPSGTAPSFTPTDVVTIVLGALAVLLTALAIIIAIAAFYGYVQIRDSAHEVARATAADTAARVAAEVAAPIAAREARAAVQETNRQDTARISEALIDDNPAS